MKRGKKGKEGRSLIFPLLCGFFEPYKSLESEGREFRVRGDRHHKGGEKRRNKGDEDETKAKLGNGIKEIWDGMKK